MMLTKAHLKKQIDSLPDEFSIDELVERLFLIEKIENADRQSEAGEVLTENQLMQELNNWFK
ncbi:hypothetical protein [Leeuwenhoekiella palythoae]|uniref:Uncharacterized protein n=1 Tax=Leeuwenhoekiella palythoae TaxID=573501 RepID=A0A1M5WFP2_9FLAO|nr:hypothetical protein [Leeuwenhoekiella palythoae]RXG31342.1 hypothetical protein DSM01_483 [Leeuwenhoekiella palythoae]SHH86325.1 hypothetical protein SAMN04487999_1191 [Leeuwenhoekiella palythoae]